VQVAVRTAVPVGLVRWQTPASSYSVVVKVTFDANDGRGPATVSRDQSPLCEGETDARGLLLEPNDFVRAKPACDVVLSDSPTSSARPVRVCVGHIDINIAPPLTTLVRDGSCGPPEQRIPIPTLPLVLTLEHVGRRSIAIIPTPAPAAAILVRGQARAAPIKLRADTVLVHPWQPRVTVVFRGVFQHVGDVDRDVQLLVDVSGRMSATPQRDMQDWFKQDAAESSSREPPYGDAPPAYDVLAPGQKTPVDLLAPQPTMQMEAELGQAAPPSVASDLRPLPTLEMDAAELTDPPRLPTLTMAAVDMDAGMPVTTLEVVVHADGSSVATTSTPAPSSYPVASAPSAPPAPPVFAPTFGPPPSAPVFAPTFGPRPLSVPAPPPEAAAAPLPPLAPPAVPFAPPPTSERLSGGLPFMSPAPPPKPVPVEEPFDDDIVPGRPPPPRRPK